MPRKRYSVTVRYEQEREITVWAQDHQEAEEKAAEIVEGWESVISAEPLNCEEAD